MLSHYLVGILSLKGTIFNILMIREYKRSSRENLESKLKNLSYYMEVYNP